MNERWRQAHERRVERVHTRRRRPQDWIHACRGSACLRARRAQATSGFIGAQYELLPSSFGENSGNSGLKDILVNAEGAAFGSDLMRDASTELPGMTDGPALEDRSWAELDTFDAETQGLLDKAGDLSVQGLMRSLI